MFKTLESARIPIMWGDDEESFFSFTELELNCAWFYADCKITDGETTIGTNYLLCRPSQIEEMMRNSAISIRKIYFVSPPYVNKSDYWNMSPLARVSFGDLKYENYEVRVEIYELTNGNKYYLNADNKDVDKIKNIRVIYGSS